MSYIERIQDNVYPIHSKVPRIDISSKTNYSRRNLDSERLIYKVTARGSSRDSTVMVAVDHRSIRISDRIDILLNTYKSLKYVENPPSLYAWESAKRFLQQIDALTAILSAITPSLSAADECSIDIYWEFMGNRLVINFPANNSTFPSFAGRTERKGKISGYISDDFSLQTLTTWLIGR